MSLSENNNTYLKSLRIFCIALIAGIVMFTSIVVGLNYFDSRTTDVFQGYSEIAIGVLVAAAIACFLVARQLFGKKMQVIKNSSVNVLEKLNQYRPALISYMALCDGPAIFAIILFFLTGIYWLLLVVIIMVMAMAAKFPTKQKLINDMELDWKEQQELE